MITEEILKVVNAKLNGIIGYLVLIGLIFFILAVAILFFPEIIQIIFIVAFFICAFSSFLIAVKINNIKDTFDNILTLGSKNKSK